MIATLKRDETGIFGRKCAFIDLKHNGDWATVTVVVFDPITVNSKSHMCVVFWQTGQKECEVVFSRPVDKFSGGIFVGGKAFTVTVKNGRVFVR